MGMDSAVADPQYGTGLGPGCYNAKYHKPFSQDDLGLQVNPPVAPDLVSPVFPSKKKAVPARKPKGSPKMMRKKGVNMAVNSHNQDNQPADELSAPATTLRTKKVSRRPKRLPKVSTKGGVDVVVDSNDKGDKATETGSPEL